CSSPTTEFYDPKTFITHAASLRQTFVHCGRFPTAASRRSLGRVSVPVWPITLSGRLRIVALVSFYPTNYLMRRGPIFWRQLEEPSFISSSGEEESYSVLAPVSWRYAESYVMLPTCSSPILRSYHRRPPAGFRLLPALV